MAIFEDIGKVSSLNKSTFRVTVVYCDIGEIEINSLICIKRTCKKEMMVFNYMEHTKMIDGPSVIFL